MAVKIIELFGGPMDGLQLPIKASDNQFCCTVATRDGPIVAVSNHVYTESGRVTREDRIILFEYKGDHDE